MNILGVIKREGRKDATYIENGSADSGSSLGVAQLVLHVGLGRKRSIADAVIVVEATDGHLLQVVQLYHDSSSSFADFFC